jgi:TolB-like protein
LYVLARRACCTVLSPFSATCPSAPELDVVATLKKVEAQIGFVGSVRLLGTTLRVTARIVDAAGVHLAVERIDVELGTKTSFAIEEDIATALAARFEVVRSPVPYTAGPPLP